MPLDLYPPWGPVDPPDPEPTICSGCEGRGEVGGLTPSGYESETCPFCKGTGYEQPE